MNPLGQAERSVQPQADRVAHCFDGEPPKASRDLVAGKLDQHDMDRDEEGEAHAAGEHGAGCKGILAL
ncbi:MAG: hypothetical protein ACFB9M_04030 [Myxococcota bacterium]